MKKLLIAFFLFVSSLTAQELHVIIVADTAEVLGSDHDLSNMVALSEKISQSTKMPLHLQTFSEKDFDEALVFHALESLTVAEDDVVMFYYSGHGYRTIDTESQWPVFFFGYEQNGIAMRTVIEKIQALQPRFFFVMGDSCNNFIEKEWAPEFRARNIDFTRQAKEESGYQKLFLTSKGYVLSSGSVPGKFSLGTPEGGVFTNDFLRNLRYEIEQGDPSWERVMRGAKKDSSHYQQAQFSILLR